MEALSVTKTAVSPGYAPGAAVTYVVSVVNSGTEAVSGVTALKITGTV